MYIVYLLTKNSCLHFRYVLEAFFTEVVGLIQKDETLKAHIGEIRQYKDILGVNPKMSNVNRLLVEAPSVRQRVWQLLDIAENVQIPVFPNDILYGVLSMGIHLPIIDYMTLSEQVDPAFATFLRVLAGRQNLSIQTYVEEHAAAGETLIAGERQQMKEPQIGEDLTRESSILSSTSVASEDIESSI